MRGLIKSEEKPGIKALNPSSIRVTAQLRLHCSALSHPRAASATKERCAAWLSQRASPLETVRLHPKRRGIPRAELPTLTSCCTEKGRVGKGAVRYQRYRHCGRQRSESPKRASRSFGIPDARNARRSGRSHPRAGDAFDSSIDRTARKPQAKSLRRLI